MDQLYRTVRLLYNGSSRNARWFRYALITFDALTILYFILTAALPQTLLLTIVNTVLGILILIDFVSRLWVAPNRRAMLLQLYTLSDIVVIASLLLAPLFTDELAFLRILRGLRLIHSYHLIRDLRSESRFFREHEEAVYAAVNLFVFLFVTTSFVYVVAFDEQAGLPAYIDALYFTVATLTTTGFGDITMTTPWTRLLAVFIMVVGVALFIRLAQAVFRSARVYHKCPNCGLLRHDTDAIHCKHCGTTLNIETEGDGD